MPQSLLPWVRKVVVGSTNPVKLAAVRAVMARVAPNATVQAVEVHSGVADQPWGDDETQRGAAARATSALAHDDCDADLGIGLEGGVVETNGSVRTCAWAVVAARDGRQGTGGSMAMQLPAKVVAMLHAGVELGVAMDSVAGLVDTKRRTGAVGILTAGLIDRQRAYEPLITYALAPFLMPHFYADEAAAQPAPQDQDAGASDSGR
ncbi:MAG: inosine/xanthosine triphosphatase [Gemmatimonadota bacterium]|nr:inosine/xanthosine triphosphatase [Gemmatimonadota bacterium]